VAQTDSSNWPKICSEDVPGSVSQNKCNATTPLTVKTLDHQEPMLRFFEYLAKKSAFFAQNKAKLWEKFDYNIVFFKEQLQIFRRKLSNIAENCDNNIDPRWQL
jgi:hypothetical protein